MALSSMRYTVCHFEFLLFAVVDDCIFALLTNEEMTYSLQK